MNNNNHQTSTNQPHQPYSAVPPFQNSHQMLYSIPQYHQSSTQQHHQPQQQQQQQPYFDTIPSNYIMMQNISPNQTSLPLQQQQSLQPQQPQYSPQTAAQQQFYNYQQQQLHHQQQYHHHQQQLLQQQQQQHAQAQHDAQTQQQQQQQQQQGKKSPRGKKSIKASPILKDDDSKYVIYANFPERLQQILPRSPLSRAPIRPDITVSTTAKRAKRKSKFSQEQDDMIVNLKRKGKSWVEIAEITGVDSYLAARNRYQVIVGQQGNNNSSAWDNKDKIFLQQLLDAGEFEKWKFISSELNKSTNKSFTDYECREMIRELFWLNPASFGVSEETIKECQKEKKLTEKTIEQREQQKRKRSSVIEDKIYQPSQSQPHSASPHQYYNKPYY